MYCCLCCFVAISQLSCSFCYYHTSANSSPTAAMELICDEIQCAQLSTTTVYQNWRFFFADVSFLKRVKCEPTTAMSFFFHFPFCERLVYVYLLIFALIVSAFFCFLTLASFTKIEDVSGTILAQYTAWNDRCSLSYQSVDKTK